MYKKYLNEEFAFECMAKFDYFFNDFFNFYASMWSVDTLKDTPAYRIKREFYLVKF